MRGSCISLALPKNHECHTTHKYPGKSSDFRLGAGLIVDSITCTPFCNLPRIELWLCTHVSHPRTQEAVAGGLPQVQCQPELLNETLPQQTKKSNSKELATRKGRTVRESRREKQSLPGGLFLHILGSVPLKDHLDIVFTSILQACNLREHGPA